MSTLYVVRGLPASGKTTWARAWVRQDPENRVRVNRDDLRAMLHNGTWMGNKTETAVKRVRNLLIVSLLRDHDVVCDDTNLSDRVIRQLENLLGVDDEIKLVDLRHIPLAVCLDRDRKRTGRERVGDHVIRNMYAQHIEGKTLT